MNACGGGEMTSGVCWLPTVWIQQECLTCGYLSFLRERRVSHDNALVFTDAGMDRERDTRVTYLMGV